MLISRKERRGRKAFYLKIVYPIIPTHSWKATLLSVNALKSGRSEKPFAAMTEFFRLWKRIEDAHLAPGLSAPVRYALYEGKFIRSIAVPERDCSAQELAEAISGYIKLFDRLLKGYVGGTMDAHGVEAAYYSYLTHSDVHI